MVSGWVAKAKENLSLPVEGRIIRNYFVRPSAIDELGIATIPAPNQNPGIPKSLPHIVSTSSRYSDSPEVAVHIYSSRIIRHRVVYPTRNQRRFDATPGSELDYSLRNARHPYHDAVREVYQRNSEVNIHNHLSVAAPGLSSTSYSQNPSLILARIDSGLTGSIPGVMPSMLIHKIRNGLEYLTRAELQQRYPQFFNPRGRRG